VCSDTSRYNAKVHPHLPKLTTLIQGLKDRAGIAPKVVVIHQLDAPSQDTKWTSFDAFVKLGQEKKLGRTSDGSAEIEWAQLPFDWPLWILFSSGTTGE
jgi:acetoacetyl-CoA synthetase